MRREGGKEDKRYGTIDGCDYIPRNVSIDHYGEAGEAYSHFIMWIINIGTGIRRRHAQHERGDQHTEF